MEDKVPITNAGVRAAQPNRSSARGSLMDLRMLNRICFTVCIVSIVSATLLAFILIWGSLDKETVWKSELSVGVLFLASVITLSVSRTLGGKE
jgi:hypothetical protein